MKGFFLLTMLLTFLALETYAQVTEEFKPSGRTIIRVFSNFHSTFSNEARQSAFDITRGCLGYEYNFSETLTGRVTFDVANPGVGGLKYTAYAKNALLRYKKNKLTVEFGLTPTKHFGLQENAWEHRYLFKSFNDEYKFNASTDFGMSVDYKFNDFLQADLGIYNGEGDRLSEADSILRYSAGLTISPIKGLNIRGYFDAMPGDETQSSVATYIGYVHKKFSVGVEYNMQNNNKYKADHSLSGISTYASVNFTEKVQLFGRFDNVTSNLLDGDTENWNLAKDGQMLIVGLEFAPVKTVKIAPNFQHWSPADEAGISVSSFFLSVEFNLK